MTKYFTRLNYVFFLVMISVNGQQTMQTVEIKTPESHSFQKYGNIPINMHTGSLDLKIPIVSQEGVNIVLSYDSSGFIPHNKPGIVGTNWSFIAGGRITRKMNYMPDEYVGNPQSIGGNPFDSGMDLHGFLTGVRLNPYTNSQAFNLNSGVGHDGGIYWYLGTPENGYEGEPDEFIFNVMDLHGKFIIGNDGIPKVESDDPSIVVDISGIQTYSLNYDCMIPNSEIVITDGSGTKYYFGGDFSRFEISYYRQTPGISEYDYYGFPYVSSFSISKVVFANGQTINFEYEEGTLNEDFCTMLQPTRVNILANAKILSLESFYHDGTVIDEWQNCDGPNFCGQTYCSMPTTNTSYALIKKSLLKSISFENLLVEINYRDIGYPIKHSHPNTLNTFFLNEYVVANVVVKIDNQTYLTNNFNYMDKGTDGFKRPFLESITEVETEKVTSFEYYNCDYLPPYYTKGIDHWGFWTGLDANLTLTPFDTYNQNTGDYTLNNTFRDANLSKYDVGLLKKVTYPTKGYSEFIYEPQNYGKRIERLSTSNFLPTVTNNTGYIGGARVWKQNDYSATGVISTQKEYKYTTTLDGNVSSGILMNWPRYMYYLEFQSPGMLQKLMIRTSSNVQENTLDFYNIGYSKVFEIEGNNGFTEYTFSDFETHPDVMYPEVTNTLNYLNLSQASPENLYKNFKNLYGIDKSKIRGKILNVKYRSNTRELLKEKIYTYSDITELNNLSNIDNNNYVTYHHLSGFWVQGYRKYLNTSKLLSEINVDYFVNPVSTTSEYIYNSPLHLNLTSETITNSLGETSKQKFSYAQDNELAAQPQINNLISRNIKSIPLDIKVFKVDNTGNEVCLLQQLTEYGIFPGNTDVPVLLLPKYIYLKKGNESTIPLEINATYDYDSKGNIKQYLIANGTPVSVIWGYHQSKPIAKLEGISYQQIPQDYIEYLQTLTNAINPDESLIINALNTLRNNPILSNVMVSTFTYKPLIGITSITDAKGDIFYYEYDDSYRLKYVRDKFLNIISENEYHYGNEE